MKKSLLTLAAACLLPLTGLHAADLTVHAAISLTDALQELQPAYEKSSGDKLVFNFGGSSVLAKQIQEGAPGDVFFSADEAKMNTLEKAGSLLPGTRENLLGNTLVIVVPYDSTIKITSASALTESEIKKISVAEPNSVPAGVYTKEYLTKLGLWEKVQPKVVPADNVRAALGAVESGNVDAGTVYKTDALISKKAKVAYEVPASDGPKILYPVAALKDSKSPEAAKKLLKFLGSDEARTVFKKYGFTVLK